MQTDVLEQPVCLLDDDASSCASSSLKIGKSEIQDLSTESLYCSQIRAEGFTDKGNHNDKMEDPTGWSLTESDPQVFTQLLRDLGVKGLQVVSPLKPFCSLSLS